MIFSKIFPAGAFPELPTDGVCAWREASDIPLVTAKRFNR
jgi:hypothetical protein